jgi:hypothetical protein
MIDLHAPGMRDFLASMDGVEGCWNWPKYCNGDGYGLTKLNGKTTVATRVSYQLKVGSIPSGMNVCHSCDNPPCCNPAHLFPGTHGDNYQDAKAKDRHSRGERNGIAKFTDDQVRYVRSSPKTQWELANEFGVWQGTISCIKRRTRWAHVAD